MILTDIMHKCLVALDDLSLERWCSQAKKPDSDKTTSDIGVYNTIHKRQSISQWSLLYANPSGNVPKPSGIAQEETICIKDKSTNLSSNSDDAS